MTSIRTPIRRSTVRGAALALLTGAGIALTPLTASAGAPAPAPVAPAAAPAPAAPAGTVGRSVPVANIAQQAAAPTQATQVAVNAALGKLGAPYRWGGTGAGGYDCSGLTWSAYQAAGINLPRTSRAQATVGVPVSRANLQPGDLVFFYQPIGHVGIYLGNGQMVHSSTYGQPVSVVNIDSMYGYNTARRVA